MYSNDPKQKKNFQNSTAPQQGAPQNRMRLSMPQGAGVPPYYPMAQPQGATPQAPAFQPGMMPYPMGIPQGAGLPGGQLPQMMPQAMPMQAGMAQPLPAGGQDDRRIDPAEFRRQAEELSRKLPEFQLETEIENPQFCKYILENRLTVEEAYLLTHREELAGKAKAEAMEDFRSRRDRIQENGTGRTSGASVRMNPRDMRDEDIAAIIKRVQRGEKISF